MDLTGRDPDVAANLLTMTLVEAGATADAATTPDIFLEVRLDDGDRVSIPQMVSPDSDYFWLDQVTLEPFHLEVGEHTIRYEYAAEGESSNPGLAKVDAFYLQPVVARRVFEHPDRRTFTLTYNTLTGETTWGETNPD
jgi:hypothetical protein